MRIDVVTGTRAEFGILRPLVLELQDSAMLDIRLLVTGMHLIRDNATRKVPRPLIIEMGGKNPSIITRTADLDKATDGEEEQWRRSGIAARKGRRIHPTGNVVEPLWWCAQLHQLALHIVRYGHDRAGLGE